MAEFTKTYSYLDLVKACDSFPYDADTSELYKLYIGDDDRPHGYMLPSTVQKMPWTSHFQISHTQPLRVHLTNTPPTSSLSDFSTYCNAAFAAVINAAIDADLFSVLHGEHSEPFLIPGLPGLVHLERYAAPLFGIVSRGSHMTVYTRTADNELKVWVAKRSMNLFTYPGKYDTTVAGGIKATETPFETIVHEADEEASLPSSMILAGAKAVGAITYMKMSGKGSGGERGLVGGDVLYLYDLEVEEGVVPKPRDEEVEGFYLMDVHEVKKRMGRGEFKTNSAVVMIDFFVRMGVITMEEEPDYEEILWGMRRRLPFPTNGGR
ncbi:NUDIX domain-containing protein [Rutstroemia sp. NJR-2017a WRK4]|nr:NUDIX domain-containing protein [Rutstroemia sp. NJR-2017a WRK4]